MDPQETQSILYIPMLPKAHCRITLQIIEEPVGAMDRPHRRPPRLEEMDAITDGLRRRLWSVINPNPGTPP
jgi:hypothetical protein